MSAAQFQQQMETAKVGGALGMPIIASPDVAEPVMRYGVPAAATAGAFAAAPAGILSQAATGAGTSVISDLWGRFVDKLMGVEREPLTAQGEATSAITGAAGGALLPGLEAASGLKAARAVVDTAGKEAAQDNIDLAAQQQEVRSELAKRQAISDAGTQRQTEQLEARQDQVRQDIAQRQSQADAAQRQQAQELQQKQAGVRHDLTKRQALADAARQQQIQELGQQQTNIRQDITQRQQAENIKAQEASRKLRGKQAKVRGEIVQQRAETAQEATAKHQKTVRDIQEQVTKAHNQLNDAHKAAMETARPKIAQRLLERRAQQMVGKTPAELTAQEAEPYEQRSAALAHVKDPYFDAALKFHREVGDKFEPYLKESKNIAVKPEDIEGVRAEVGNIRNTLDARGLRIPSSELNQTLDTLVNPTPEMMLEVDTPEGQARVQSILRDHGWSKRHFGDASSQEQLQAARANLQEHPEELKPLTYGQLWGLRSRANRILATSQNPADRWAADQIVSKLTDTLPNVPPQIRKQYAFERTLMKDITRDVAGSRTPAEVGDSMFNPKTPAEAPLQVIRFTKRFNPEGIAGLKESFADYYLKNPGKLGELNPNIIHELYGNEAGSVLRLLGPEGDAAMRTTSEIIRESPETRHEFEQAWDEELTKSVNIDRRKAIQSGQQALADLGSEYDSVRRALAVAQTPEAKLRILEQDLPLPEQIAPTKAEQAILERSTPPRQQIQPTKTEAATLAEPLPQRQQIAPSKGEATTLAEPLPTRQQVTPSKTEADTLSKQPVDPREAQLAALKKQLSYTGSFEKYIKHHLAWQGFFALTAQVGWAAKRPGLLIPVGGLIGWREGIRYALTTPRGADLYLRLLETKNPALIARGLAGMVSSIASSILREQFDQQQKEEQSR